MATALLWAKRYKEAMVAAKRALSRVYGRRKARVLGLMAQIYQGLGERQAQLETLAAIVAHHRSLPPSTRREADIEQAQRKLEEAHTSKGE